MYDISWFGDAACRGRFDDFFPEPSVGALTAARKICAECPVKMKCLDYGLELVDSRKTKETITRGIWGGLSCDELVDMIGNARNDGELSDHECEHPRCANRTPFGARGNHAPSKYCSTRCLKAASASKHWRANHTKADTMQRY